LLPFFRFPPVLHSLKDRVADTIRKDAISLGGACVRVDRPRVHRRDSIVLMLEEG
jgi:hypothetical protein